MGRKWEETKPRKQEHKLGGNSRPNCLWLPCGFPQTNICRSFRPKPTSGQRGQQMCGCVDGQPRKIMKKRRWEANLLRLGLSYKKLQGLTYREPCAGRKTMIPACSVPKSTWYIIMLLYSSRQRLNNPIDYPIGTPVGSYKVT